MNEQDLQPDVAADPEPEPAPIEATALAGEPREPRGRRRLRWLLPLGIALAALVVYAGTLEAPFIFDDEHALVENPRIRSLATAWSGPPDSPLTGRPVASLSFGLNYALGELDVKYYRELNVLLHALATLLLYGLVRRTLRLAPLAARFGATAEWLAGAAALLWALHPLLTESVIYVVQRTELLMACFYLATLYCVLRGATDAERRRRWFAFAVAACALGMGSKEVMVSAPLAVLLYDRLFLAGSFRAALAERRGLYAGLAATWVLLVLLVLTGGGRDASVGLGFEQLTPITYLRTQAEVIVHYLRLAAWPSPLVLDYDDWPLAESWSAVLPETLLLVALLALTVWGVWKGARASFLGAIFFLVLAPTSSLLPITTEVAAERRMYLPLAALVVLAVVGIYALLQRGAGWPRRPPRAVAAALGLGVLLLAGTLAWATVERGEDYRSALSIYGDTVAKRPSNARAMNNYGVALLAAGRRDEAIGYFSSALEISPNESTYTNLGIALAERGQAKLAVEQYEQALALDPDNVKTLVNLGNALLQLGRVDEAVERFRAAIEHAPERAEAYNGMAVARWHLGEREAALADFQRAIELAPDYRDAHFNLGMAHFESESLGEAEKWLKAAARLDSEHALAQFQLGLVLARQGRAAEAVPIFRQVVRLRPEDPEAELNLAKALASSDRLAEALGHYERAVELAPRSAVLASSLAWTYATHRDAAIRDGAKAVRYAEAARALTGDDDPVTLDTLAAAYAEAGRFDDALAAARRALELARAAGRDELAADVERHLEELRAGRPIRSG